MRILLIALAAFLALASLSCEGRNVADSTITARVKSKLAADAETSALNINVDTNGGVVTLSGAVTTEAEKSRAEQLARETEGVTRVINNITVLPSSTGETSTGEKAGEGSGGADVTASDNTIQSKVQTRYVSEGIIGANVDVDNGVVTLKGEVENAQEKARAESIAKATEGVKSVKNMLVVKQ